MGPTAAITKEGNNSKAFFVLMKIMLQELKMSGRLDNQMK